jgi:3'-5' exonuclease
MLDKISLQNILFLDIETVPQVYTCDSLSDQMRSLWDSKMQYFKKDGNEATTLYHKAGIYAEFGKVVCVSIGTLQRHNFKHSLHIKSFFGDNEKLLLKEFKEFLWTNNPKKNMQLCAHNGKEFDFPFLARRMLINGIKLPPALDNSGKKPWEVNHIDTLDLWKFGDYKNFSSLALLAAVFNIPSPKNDMDGSQVAKVYWEEKNLKRIVSYCQMDVLTLAQLLLKFKGEQIIEAGNVFIAE